MLNYKTLENTDIKILHEGFIKAFSDYQVKMDLPLWKLQQMLQRRGYVPALSMGAFKEDELVGFVLNGFRSWNGKSTVYDTGTGVIPDYRRQGITTNMFQNNVVLLKEKNITQYLLEVIQSNKSALELYQKQGFEITRSFRCYQLEKCKYTPVSAYQVEHLDKIDETVWEQLKTFWDIQPSWQNSIDSVRAIADEFIYSFVRIDNAIVGYGIIDKKTGDIPQLGVSKSSRRQGIGSSILTDLINSTISEKITVLNIDDESKSTKDFFNKLGFQQYVDQYEMILQL